MKTKINGFEIEGSVSEIRQLILADIPTKPAEKPAATIRGHYKKRLPNKNKKYSPEDIKLVWKMFTQGKKPLSVARAVGRTRESVKWLKWMIKHKYCDIKTGKMDYSYKHRMDK